MSYRESPSLVTYMVWSHLSILTNSNSFIFFLLGFIFVSLLVLKIIKIFYFGRLLFDVQSLSCVVEDLLFYENYIIFIFYVEDLFCFLER